MSNNLTRNLYLKAMGIDVWVARDIPPLDDSNKSHETNVHEDAIKADIIDESSSVNELDNLEIVANKRINSTQTDVSKLDWEQLEIVANSCQRCELLKTRTNSVFGSGNTQADLFIVGSIPNQNEGRLNQEFIEAEGALLDNMLRTVNLSRKDVYTSNLIKCNPQQLRHFSVTEMNNCIQFIHRQITLVDPKVLIIFGEQIAQFILNTDKNMATLTTQLHDYENSDALVVVIEHPEQLLLSASKKKQAWLGLLKIKTILNK